jgi:hypothetical protein
VSGQRDIWRSAEERGEAMAAAMSSISEEKKQSQTNTALGCLISVCLLFLALIPLIFALLVYIAVKVS